ncbi:MULTISPECIES: ester cyclase [unclassified Pseudomonas]|uniref:ester cyclase n=1 Tax=unclassified Pseudomonas TaxID=196821 RepID=UPI0030DA9C1F
MAARLAFNCTPAGELLGLAVNGARIAFTENVFYAFEDGRIREVWSIIDKEAIEAQRHSTSRMLQGCKFQRSVHRPRWRRVTELPENQIQEAIVSTSIVRHTSK